MQVFLKYVTSPYTIHPHIIQVMRIVMRDYFNEETEHVSERFFLAFHSTYAGLNNLQDSV